MKATIKVRNLGQAFACDAVVLVKGEVVHTTRDYPHGMRHTAYDAAVTWAQARGYDVLETV